MNKLIDAALAVVERWDSPKWAHDSTHTSELIFALREALREHTLGCLTETHQQLGEQLGEELGEQLGEELGEELGETEDVTLYVRDADEEYAYNKWGHLELIGTIDGTYGGRWMLDVEDKAAVWPDGTAVYVRRIKR